MLGAEIAGVIGLAEGAAGEGEGKEGEEEGEEVAGAGELGDDAGTAGAVGAGLAVWSEFGFSGSLLMFIYYHKRRDF